MKPNRTERALRILVLGVLPFLVTLSITAVATECSAQGLFVVNGVARDQVGNPMEGVNITVNIWNPAMTVINGTLYDDATDEDGFYSVTFGGFGGYDVKVGDNIEVIANYDSHFGTNDSTVASIPPIFCTVDVSITTIVIPEFGLGQGVGFPAAIIGILAVFAIVGRRRARH